SHSPPPAFAGGKRLFLPKSPAADMSRRSGSKSPFARHQKGGRNWENSLWSGPSTRHGWPAAGEIRSNDRLPATHSTCNRLTKRAHKTPRKSVSGRGGLRLGAGQS